MIVQLLVFEGCPLAAPARENLKKAIAMASCGIDNFEEIDILDPESPEELRSWGSPTILVNGKDITGHAKGDSVSCRLYDSPGGVPAVESMIDILESFSR